MLALDRIVYILVVEDEESQLEYIEHVFNSQSWATLTVARSIAEAKEKLNAFIPDLVITDLRLPDGEGTELLVPIKKAKTRSIETIEAPNDEQPFPVVVMTGHGNEQAAVDAMKAGALDYLVKSHKMIEGLPTAALRALRSWDQIIKRRRSEQALRKNLARMELLHSTARTLIAVDTLSNKLKSVADNAAEALPASMVTITIVDLANRQVVEQVVGGLDIEGYITSSFDDVWDGLSGWVLRRLEPALSPKHKDDERESKVSRERRAKMNAGSMMIVPLTYQGRTLGIMSAINRTYERDFNERNLELLKAIANQASGAIENTRLLDETSRLLQQVQRRAGQIQEIIDAVPDGILLLNDEYRVIQANTVAQEYLLTLSGVQLGEILAELGKISLQEILRRPAAGQTKLNTTLTSHGRTFSVSAQSIQTDWTLIIRELIPNDNSS